MGKQKLSRRVTQWIETFLITKHTHKKNKNHKLQCLSVRMEVVLSADGTGQKGEGSWSPGPSSAHTRLRWKGAWVMVFEVKIGQFSWETVWVLEDREQQSLANVCEKPGEWPLGVTYCENLPRDGQEQRQSAVILMWITELTWFNCLQFAILTRAWIVQFFRGP